MDLEKLKSIIQKIFQGFLRWLQKLRQQISHRLPSRQALRQKMAPQALGRQFIQTIKTLVTYTKILLSKTQTLVITLKTAFRDRKQHKANLQVQLSTLRTKLSHELSKEQLARRAHEFDPQKFMESLTEAVQNKGLRFYAPLFAIILSTYFLSDLFALIVESYIPDPPTSKNARLPFLSGRSKGLQDYNIISIRNLFDSGGDAIDDDQSGTSPNPDYGGPPTKSALPLELIGTLIMQNEAFSIATIDDKDAKFAFAVRIDDEIAGGKVKITKIEATRVYFINKSTNRREYIELPEDQNALKSTAPITKITVGASPSPTSSGVEKVSSTQFNVARSEIDKALADFNNILTQARAVPNIENGVPSGYKLFQIVPGSIYDKLGLQNGDTITGLNGKPINDPAKAFEMLTELKTANHLELQVKSNGKTSTYTYDIQ